MIFGSWIARMARSSRPPTATKIFCLRSRAARVSAVAISTVLPARRCRRRRQLLLGQLGMSTGGSARRTRTRRSRSWRPASGTRRPRLAERDALHREQPSVRVDLPPRTLTSPRPREEPRDLRVAPADVTVIGISVGPPAAETCSCGVIDAKRDAALRASRQSRGRAPAGPRSRASPLQAGTRPRPASPLPRGLVSAACASTRRSSAAATSALADVASARFGETISIQTAAAYTTRPLPRRRGSERDESDSRRAFTTRPRSAPTPRRRS